MAENKMKEVAELLGVEIDKPFNIKGYKLNPCKLTNERIINNRGDMITMSFFKLLTGKLEVEQVILDDVERRYLENVLKPFKDRILFAKKTTIYNTDSDYEYVCFKVVTPDNEDYNYLILPYFIKGTMYKEMKIDKDYSLEELGLFEGDGEKDVD